MKIIPYLQMGRVMTSALTQAVVAIGYLLGSPDPTWLGLLPWLVFGGIGHYFGFLANTVLDYKHDLRDPNKAHHPLVTGAVSYIAAVKVLAASLFILMTLGVTLAYQSKSSISWLLLFSGFAVGMAYNVFSKKQPIAPVYVGGCYFLFFTLFPYSAGGRLDTLFPALMFSGYLAVVTFLNTALTGCVKDLATDPVNLLKTLGTRLQDNTYIPSFKATTLILSFEALRFLLGLGLAATFDNTGIAIGIYIVLSLIAIILNSPFTHRNPYDHHWLHKIGILIVIFSYFALLAALTPFIRLDFLLFLGLYPTIFYIASNRVLWRSILRPNV